MSITARGQPLLPWILLATTLVIAVVWFVVGRGDAPAVPGSPLDVSGVALGGAAPVQSGDVDTGALARTEIPQRPTTCQVLCVDRAGLPLPNVALVEARPGDRYTRREVRWRTDGDGQARIDPPQTGVLLLVACLEGYVAQQVLVSRGTPAQVVTLAPTPTQLIRVQDGGGQPVPDLLLLASARPMDQQDLSAVDAGGVWHPGGEPRVGGHARAVLRRHAVPVLQCDDGGSSVTLSQGHPLVAVA